MNKEVWSVIYWDNGEEPIISLFDNEEAARKCYEYFTFQQGKIRKI